MAKKKTDGKSGHGGARPGTGKPTFFRGKDPKAWAILLRGQSKRIVDAGQKRIKGISRSDFIEALIVLYGPTLTTDDVSTVAG